MHLMILYYRNTLEFKKSHIKKIIREVQAQRKRSEKNESPSPFTLSSFSINDKWEKSTKKKKEWLVLYKTSSCLDLRLLTPQVTSHL